MRIVRLIILTGIAHLCVSPGYAQSDTIKYSAYELLSDYYNNDFNPFKKKNAYVGLAFTIQNSQLENTPRLLNRIQNGSESDFSIKLAGGYFIRNHVMAELGIMYSRDKFEGSLFNQDGDSLYRRQISNLAVYSPGVRTYFPLSANERFSLFNSLSMGFGFGQSLSRDQFNVNRIEKVYSKEFEFSLGISPGITFFAIENFAFEVQLQNLIGYTYRQWKSTVNDTEESTRRTHNVNFNINLLSLQLGLSYYFGTK